jgi:hypothetical protein
MKGIVYANDTGDAVNKKKPVSALLSGKLFLQGS